MQIKVTSHLTLDTDKLTESDFHPDAQKCSNCGSTHKSKSHIEIPYPENYTIVRFFCHDCAEGYIDVKYCDTCKRWIPAITREKEEISIWYFSRTHLHGTHHHQCKACHARKSKCTQSRKKEKTSASVPIAEISRCSICSRRVKSLMCINVDNEYVYLCEECYQRTISRKWDTDRMYGLADFLDLTVSSHKTGMCIICNAVDGNFTSASIHDDVSVRMCPECYRIYYTYPANTKILRNAAAIISKISQGESTWKKT